MLGTVRLQKKTRILSPDNNKNLFGVTCIRFVLCKGFFTILQFDPLYRTTECPKIYRKSILKQMQYRFAVNFGTLNRFREIRTGEQTDGPTDGQRE